MVICMSSYMRVFRLGETSVSHLKQIRTVSSSLCRDPTIIFLPHHHCSIILNVLTLVWYGRSVSQPLYQDTLRHCATSQKVSGSIPDVGNGIFQCLNPSDRTMALWSTDPLREMNTRNFLGEGERWSMRRAHNLTTFRCGLSSLEV